MTTLELGALAFLISVIMGVGAGLTHAVIVAYSIKGISEPYIIIVLMNTSTFKEDGE